MNLPFNFDKAIDGLAKVTLRGGVVGKVTFTISIVSISMAAISWPLQNIWIAGAALAAVFILSMTLLLRLVSFADKNPKAALLEGAEFIVHEQIIHATKTHRLTAAEREPTQPEEIKGQAAIPEIALQPDENNSDSNQAKE